jgi:Na+/alanine symporter
MNTQISLLIYLVLALFLAIDGIMTLFHRDTLFQKHQSPVLDEDDLRNDLLTGLLLIAAGFTVAMFGLRAVLKVSWTQVPMWTGIVIVLGIMVVLAVKGQRKR